MFLVEGDSVRGLGALARYGSSMGEVLTGRLVRLAAIDHEEMSKALIRWNLNSEYQRLGDASPYHIQSAKSIAKWFEGAVGEMLPAKYFFSIRTLAEDKLIG